MYYGCPNLALWPLHWLVHPRLPSSVKVRSSTLVGFLDMVHLAHCSSSDLWESCTEVEAHELQKQVLKFRAQLPAQLNPQFAYCWSRCASSRLHAYCDADGAGMPIQHDLTTTT